MQRAKGALSSRHIIRNNSGCQEVTKDDMSALENVGKRVSQPLLPLAGPAADNRREIELPSAAEVLSKHIAALGGEQNLKKITTRRDAVKAGGKASKPPQRVLGVIVGSTGTGLCA
jgi:hypothetical protein